MAGVGLSWCGLDEPMARCNEREPRPVLRASPQRDQRQEALQAKRIEGAETPAVQNDLDFAKKSYLQPDRRFTTGFTRVIRH